MLKALCVCVCVSVSVCVSVCLSERERETCIQRERAIHSRWWNDEVGFTRTLNIPSDVCRNKFFLDCEASMFPFYPIPPSPSLLLDSDHRYHHLLQLFKPVTQISLFFLTHWLDEFILLLFISKTFFKLVLTVSICTCVS